MNILAYPLKYILPAQLPDGTLVQLRPIHPLDGGRATAFRSTLSDESMWARFHGYIPAISAKLIKRLTQIDYQQEMAIIAELPHEEEKEIIAVARIVAIPEREQAAEFAIIIADRWQGRGLGSLLTDLMIRIARDLHFSTLYAYVTSRNMPMLEILRRRGFTLDKEDETTVVTKLALE
ncbi:MAG: GNAT family N-acetyltransferase [Bacteroidetes bacterium]|nr:MAG: GNAT family N-acetyltransferase [Bacteroidota bacterium]